MKNKKPLVFLVLILLIGVVGGTFAYYSHSKSIDNEFIVGDFNVVIEKDLSYSPDDTTGLDFSTNTPEDVGEPGEDSTIEEIYKVDIVNKENTDAIIRVSYNEYFKNMNLYNENYGADETEYEIASDTYDLRFEIEFNWNSIFLNDFIYKDGWYYYKKVLPGNETINILNSIYFYDMGEGFFTYDNFNLDFNLEAVQATPAAVKEIWGNEITISESGEVDWNF